MHVTLTHVRLLVDDVPKCLAFYRDILGLAPEFIAEDDSYAALEAGTATVSIFRRNLMASAIQTSNLSPKRPSAQDRVALILRVGDVNATAGELQAAGLGLLTAPHDEPNWGIRCLHVRDPDGNLVELNQPIEYEGPRNIA